MVGFHTVPRQESRVRVVAVLGRDEDADARVAVDLDLGRALAAAAEDRGDEGEGDEREGDRGDDDTREGRAVSAVLPFPFGADLGGDAAAGSDHLDDRVPVEEGQDLPRVGRVAPEAAAGAASAAERRVGPVQDVALRAPVRRVIAYVRFDVRERDVEARGVEDGGHGDLVRDHVPRARHRPALVRHGAEAAQRVLGEVPEPAWNPNRFKIPST